MINPWKHPFSIWKTKSQYFVWLRGNLRKIWSDNPLRKVWKDNQLREVTPEEKRNKVFHPSTKKVGQCYLCKDWMAGSKLECDHINESNGCYDFESAGEFLWHCAADDPANWGLVCNPCHKVKSYSIRQGITFEEAKAEKEAIQIIKGKQDKVFLEGKGIIPASNQKGRREQIVKYLLEGEDG